MRIDEYITSLRRNHSIIISVDGDALTIKASKERPGQHIVDEIRARKAEIIAFYKKAENKKNSIIIPAAPEKLFYAASSAQKRLFFTWQMDDLSLAYNLPQVIKLTGEVDVTRLNQAFRRLIDRHEILRTSFGFIDEMPVQTIWPEADFSISCIPAGDVPVAAILEDFVQPFDLHTAPLMRAVLISVSDQEHILAVDMHHIISDGVSQGIIIRDFALLYNDRDLPVLPVRYRDYSEWQQRPEQQELLAGQKDFWLQEFATLPPALELPIDFERPAVRDHAGRLFSFELDEEQTALLKKLAEENGVTLYMLLLAVYYVMLSKLGNSTDIVVGTSTSGRQANGLEHVAGMFVNLVAIRNYPEGRQSFSDFLAAVKAKTLACFDHQSYQYEALVNELNITRDPARNPLFDVMFNFYGFRQELPEIPGVLITPYEYENTVSKFDLTFSASEADGKLLFSVEYASTLFTAATIGRLATYYRNIVADITRHPGIRLSAVQMMDRTEQQHTLDTFTNVIALPAGTTVLTMLEEQCRLHPDNIALRFEDISWSYSELKATSDRFAAMLRSDYGIVTGSLVGILMDRSIPLVVAILGILKAGGVYVPLDPEYPLNRIHTILEESGLEVLVADAIYAKGLAWNGQVIVAAETIDTTPLSGEQPPVTPADLAYIIYTSGTTGKPKGVVIPHGALFNYIRWAAGYYVGTDGDNFAFYSSISFDLTVTSLFTPLVSGNTMVIYGGEDKADLLWRVFSEGAASLIKVTPSHLRLLLGMPEFGVGCTHRLKLIVGGEQLESALAQEVHNRLGGNVVIYNEYGPTETTVGCMISRFVPGSTAASVPIGYPVANARIYLLDKYQQLVAAGVEGELYVSGEVVGAGYWRNETLTDSRFLPDPFVPGLRMYKTGDVAVWLPETGLVYRGREDEQLKLRGYRIEPAEIEQVLLGYDGIREAVVTGNDQYLSAYYVGDQEADSTALRAYLQARLPAYMVPAYYTRLASLPLTMNGKLDKKALPAPQRSVTATSTAPLEGEEQLLWDIWSKVLGNENIGVTDNFFAIGGDSIKAIQITARMRSAGYEITVKEILQHQTIRQLVIHLRSLTTATDQSAVTGESALTPVQHWFYESPIVDREHFNQSVMLHFDERLSVRTVKQIFEKLQHHHDALRMVFRAEGGDIKVINAAEMALSLELLDLREEPEAADLLTAFANRLQSGIHLETGPLMKLGLCDVPDGSRLLIVLHHLVVDGVSWRILLEDIGELYNQLRQGLPLVLPLKTAPFISWAAGLREYMESAAYSRARAYWQNRLEQQLPALSRDYPDGAGSLASVQELSFELDREDTWQLLSAAHTPFRTQINDLLLSAFLLGMNEAEGMAAVEIDMEAHGREPLTGMDFTRTVGWFTTFYPVLLEKQGEELHTVIRQVKETLRGVPHQGMDYLLYRYYDQAGPSGGRSRIIFNYLGQFDTATGESAYQVSEFPQDATVVREGNVLYDWTLSGQVTDGQLKIRIAYSPEQYSESRIASLMAAYKTQLLEVINYCCNYGSPLLTPSDLSYPHISMRWLDELQQAYPIEDIYPLTSMQEGILYHSLLEADSYYTQLVLAVKQPLDISIVENSVNELIARYDVLRTVFLHETDGRSVQLVLKERKVDFSYADLRSHTFASSGEAIQYYRNEDRNNPPRPDKDALVRLKVLQFAEDDYTLIWGHHHILMDGWSMSIILKDFIKLYAGNKNGRKEILPAVQPFAGYVKWLEDRTVEDAALYWKNYLAGYNNRAQVPRKESAQEDAAFSLASHQFIIPGTQTKLVQAAAAKQQVSLNTFFQCLWGILLAKYNNVNDVVFGAVVSGRPAVVTGVETMVGLFINTIPVRVRFSAADSVSALLQRVQQEMAASGQHDYLSLSKVQSLCEAGRELLDHIMVFENFPIEQQIAGGDADELFTNVAVHERTSYPLTLTVAPSDTILVRFDYNTNIYHTDTIERLSGHLMNLLDSLTLDTDMLIPELAIVGEEEKELLLTVFNDTARAYPVDETIMDLFDRQCEKTPDNIALRYETYTLTYAALQARANKIAAYLRDKAGILPRDFVGIMLERDEDLIPVIFGILKAGAAYIPIDPHYPAARINAILQDAGPRLLISREQYLQPDLNIPAGVLDFSLVKDDIENYEAGNPVKLKGTDLAYVMYTSGSTGVPKGVMIAHYSLVNLLLWGQEQFPLDSSDVLLLKTPIIFDVSDWEIFWWVCSGASLCILKPGAEKEPLELVKAIKDNKVTALQFVPSMLHALLSALDGNSSGLESVKLVFSSGETLKPACVDLFAATLFRNCGTRLINAYGPTEITVHNSFYECDLNAKYTTVPIGRPINNTRFYVLDNMEQLCPVGVEGELYAAGAGLALGYLNNSTLTARQFVTGQRAVTEKMYRTGDLVRWLPDGNLEFRGRVDEQVKVRGYRIEPGDIEQALLSHPLIKEAVVICFGQDDHKYLAAYYLGLAAPDSSSLRAYLQSRLPEYMVPAYYTRLEAWPLTVSEKLNRKALPEPQLSAVTGNTAPVGNQEQLLWDIWTKVLGNENIGVTDNFFGIGGDSIKAIQISARARINGYEITVRDVLQHQTIRQLAPRLKSMTTAVEQSTVEGTAALTPVQRWFFESPIVDREHFNQSVMLHFDERLSAGTVKQIFEKLQHHHDALRMAFRTEGADIKVINAAEMALSLELLDLREEPEAAALLTAFANNIQSGIHLETGPLMKLGLCDMPDGSRLLIVLHHLVVDGVSWRILLEDVGELYNQLQQGLPLALPLKTAPFISWATGLREYMESTTYSRGRAYWQNRLEHQLPALSRDYPDGAGSLASVQELSFELGREDTWRLLSAAHTPFHTQINDLLLSAFLLGMHETEGLAAVEIDMEGHGREPLTGMDFSRTVGWFTTFYPVLLEKQGEELHSIIRQVKETLRGVPHQGIDYMLYRYYEQSGGRLPDHARIIFNYLGQFDTDTNGNGYRLSQDSRGEDTGKDGNMLYDWMISGAVTEGQLRMRIQYSPEQYTAGRIEAFMAAYRSQLLEVISYCCSYGKKLLSPSDLSYPQVSLPWLDTLQQAVNIADVYPLTPMQEGMLYHAVLSEEAASYFGHTVCWLKGPVNITAMEQGINEIMARHEVLRTSFLHEGLDRCLQVVHQERKVRLTYQDIREQVKETGKELCIQQYCNRDKALRFDLSKDVLMRYALLQMAADEYALVWSHHHILMDGWCISILIREFMELYTASVKGRSWQLPPVPPYARYILWLETREQEKARHYWQEYLADYNQVATLPAVTGNTAAYVSTTHSLILDTIQVAALQQAAARYNVTVNTIIQCAWGILLARYNNTTDVVFGLVVSGRTPEVDGIESMVGVFINTIPVRVSLADDVQTLLERVQQAAIDSEPYQYHALSEIQSLSAPGKELLDHIMIIENFPLAGIVQDTTDTDLFGVQQVQYEVQTNYDLNIKVLPFDQFEIRFDYNANKFDPAMIAQVAGHLVNVVDQLTTAPDLPVAKVSLYNKKEQQHIQQHFSADLHITAAETIQEMLRNSFEKYATHCAVEDEGNRYTYRELEDHAGRIAAALMALPTAGKGRIGVLCKQRYWVIAGMLGILRTGGAFVLLEDTLPAARITSMIRQAEIRYVITDQDTTALYGLNAVTEDISWIKADELPYTDINFSGTYQPDDEVYIYFTSGSTGTPKGVIGRNSGLAHFISWEIGTFGVDHTYRFSQFTNPGFDVFMRDIFVPLCAGAAICIPGKDVWAIADGIGQWVHEQRITLIHCVPTLFRLFNTAGAEQDGFPHLKYILLAGEKILSPDIRDWYRTADGGAQLVNIYGPTETTLAKGYYIVQPEDARRKYIPVKPLPGAQFLVLDPRMEPSPLYATGEIYIRTPFRSLGYLDQPALNQYAFTDNPFNPGKGDLLYRTGDMGRACPQEETEILGRIDNQVKVRGVRIEPDDIRENILAYPGVRNAVVVARGEEEEEKVLWAYIVKEGVWEEDALRHYLNEVLPDAMMPSYLVPLDYIPLLPNGKVNRKALPVAAQEIWTQAEQPATALEKKLVRIWAEILRTEEGLISTSRSFFESGGHSVRLFHLINRIQQECGVKLSFRDVFLKNTIRDMAALIAASATVAHAVIPRAPERALYEASAAQSRIFYQHLLHSQSTMFNISLAVKVPKGIDISRVSEILALLIQRHESLRTSFVLTPEGVMQQVNEITGYAPEIIVPDRPDTPEAYFQQFIRPFDVSQAPLIRCGLLQQPAGDSLLFIDIHHIVADGASLDILINEFVAAYKGNELPPLEIRYLDYACWTSNRSRQLQMQKEFWQKELRAPLPILNMPVISENGAGDHRSALKLLSIEGAAYESVKQFTATAQVSDFMVLLSACYILLSRISGNTDIIIGSDVIGRTNPGLKQVIGTFVNILPLRVQINAGSTCNELLEQVKGRVLSAYENQDFQYDEMKALMQEGGADNKDRIVKVHFSFANIVEGTIPLEGFEPVPLKSRKNERSEYEFKLEVREAAHQFNISFIYLSALYDDATIDLLMRYYQRILLAITTNGNTLLEDIQVEDTSFSLA